MGDERRGRGALRRRVRKRWARLAALPLGALGLLVLSARLVLPDAEPAHGQRLAPRPSPRPPRATDGAPPAARGSRPPSARARALPEGLSPLAGAWRAAVLAGRRDEVLRGARALARPGGREDLLRLARDPHPRVRAYALRVLGRARDEGLRAVFEEALADPSPHVRENARWGLAELDRLRASGPPARRPR